jgi:RNA polymerase sigma factor (sigma-70 family)
MRIPDLRTIERAKDGDLNAFEELFRETYGSIYSFVSYMMGKEEAKDITQEIYMKVWKSLKGLSSSTSFVPWLYRIATNTCHDWARRKRSGKVLSMDGGIKLYGTEDEELEFQVKDKSNLEEDFERIEVLEMVKREVGNLPDIYKSVVIMHYLEGMEVGDIAKALGIPRGTALSRLARAREILKQRLRKYVDGEV